MFAQSLQYTKVSFGLKKSMRNNKNNPIEEDTATQIQLHNLQLKHNNSNIT